MGHNFKKDVKPVLVLRYSRERTLQDLQRLKAPKSIIKNAARMVDKSKQELTELGINEDMYGVFAKAHEPVYEKEKKSFNYMGMCENFIRFSQMSIRANPNISPIIPCLARHDECGPPCDEYRKASEEMIKRFNHWQDIETGEAMELPAGLEGDE